MAGVAVRRWVADPLALLTLIALGVALWLLAVGRPAEPAALLTLAAVVAAVALSGST